MIDNQKKVFWAGSFNELNKESVHLFFRKEFGNVVSISNQFYKRFFPKKERGFKNEEKGNNERLTYSTCEYRINQTADYDFIGGYMARKLFVEYNDNLIEEIWFASNLKDYLGCDLNLEFLHAFLQNCLLYKDLKRSYHFRSFIDVEENGFPMKIKMFKGEKVVENLIVRNIDDTLFDVPKGYTACSLEDILKEIA